jgi:hypothetical protein
MIVVKEFNTKSRSALITVVDVPAALTFMFRDPEATDRNSEAVLYGTFASTILFDLRKGYEFS